MIVNEFTIKNAKFGKPLEKGCIDRISKIIALMRRFVLIGTLRLAFIANSKPETHPLR